MWAGISRSGTDVCDGYRSWGSMMLLPNEAHAQLRVLMGDSVYENAQVTVANEVVHVDFEAEDLESVRIDLKSLTVPEPGPEAIS
jgi:hypothetical protein